MEFDGLSNGIAALCLDSLIPRVDDDVGLKSRAALPSRLYDPFLVDRWHVGNALYVMQRIVIDKCYFCSTAKPWMSFALQVSRTNAALSLIEIPTPV